MMLSLSKSCKKLKLLQPILYFVGHEGLYVLTLVPIGNLRCGLPSVVIFMSMSPKAAMAEEWSLSLVISQVLEAFSTHALGPRCTWTCIIMKSSIFPIVAASSYNTCFTWGLDTLIKGIEATAYTGMASELSWVVLSRECSTHTPTNKSDSDLLVLISMVLRVGERLLILGKAISLLRELNVLLTSTSSTASVS